MENTHARPCDGLDSGDQTEDEDDLADVERRGPDVSQPAAQARFWAVREAAVAPVASGVDGQRPRAFVVLEQGAELTRAELTALEEQAAQPSQITSCSCTGRSRPMLRRMACSAWWSRASSMVKMSRQAWR